MEHELNRILRSRRTWAGNSIARRYSGRRLLWRNNWRHSDKACIV